MSDPVSADAIREYYNDFIKGTEFDTTDGNADAFVSISLRAQEKGLAVFADLHSAQEFDANSDRFLAMGITKSDFVQASRLESGLVAGNSPLMGGKGTAQRVNDPLKPSAAKSWLGSKLDS